MHLEGICTTTSICFPGCGNIPNTDRHFGIAPNTDTVPTSVLNFRYFDILKFFRNAKKLSLASMVGSRQNVMVFIDWSKSLTETVWLICLADLDVFRSPISFPLNWGAVKPLLHNVNSSQYQYLDHYYIDYLGKVLLLVAVFQNHVCPKRYFSQLPRLKTCSNNCPIGKIFFHNYRMGW